MAATLVDDARYAHFFSRRGAAIRGSTIDQVLSLVERVERDVIPLAGGSPELGLLPADDLRALADDILTPRGAEVLSYGSAEGEWPLRQYLAQRMTAQGMPVEPEQVLITTGGMQGLDLVFKLFVNPGDRVVIERPTYANAIATIANYEGRFLEIPLDDDGMQVDLLEQALGAAAADTPRIAYVIPTFQNPAGVSLSLVRRRRLLELARDYRLLLLEDDAYREVRFEGDDLPSLFALDQGAGNVISINTFSKTLAPGLRVGWVAAPLPVIEKMVAARHSMDTCTNRLGQQLVSRYCASGALDRQITLLNARYRAKRDLMLAALQEQFAHLPGLRWTRPAGGWFIWMTLPDGMDSQRLFELAIEEGVAFVPGHAFAGEDVASLRTCVRLNFTSPPADHLAEGIARLRRAYDRLADAGPA